MDGNINYLSTFKKTSFIYLLFICITNLECHETDSYAEALNYKNYKEIKLYMINNSKTFTYFSIDSSVKDKLQGTIYLYADTDVYHVSDGYYVLVRFGENIEDEFILCAVGKNSFQWCRDYYAFNNSLHISSLQSTRLSYGYSG